MRSRMIRIVTALGSIAALALAGGASIKGFYGHFRPIERVGCGGNLAAAIAEVACPAP